MGARAVLVLIPPGPLHAPVRLRVPGQRRLHLGVEAGSTSERPCVMFTRNAPSVLSRPRSHDRAPQAPRRAGRGVNSAVTRTPSRCHAREREWLPSRRSSPLSVPHAAQPSPARRCPIGIGGGHASVRSGSSRRRLQDAEDIGRSRARIGLPCRAPGISGAPGARAGCGRRDGLGVDPEWAYRSRRAPDWPKLSMPRRDLGTPRAEPMRTEREWPSSRETTGNFSVG
jgi:hypothetical protein